MKAKLVEWTCGAVTLFVTTALGCGTGDIVYHPPNETSTGGEGGSGGGGTTSGDGPACAGQCVPLGPGEWLGPMLLWMGKEGGEPECPPSAPVGGTRVFAELNATNSCGACACEAPTGSCALPTTLTAAASSCTDYVPGVPNTSFDASTAWNGDCSTGNSITANQKCNGVNCVQSLTIAPLTLTETSCGVSNTPIASKQPSTWGAVAQTCHGIAAGSCASPSELCAPAVEPGFEQCIGQFGDRECPKAYSKKSVFYYGFEDTRDCTPCACSAPVGSTCSSFVSVFKDAACSSPVVATTIDATGSSCLNILPSGQALGSKSATTPVFTPGVCQASGGQPVGAAVPAEPLTFCCLEG
jgi:hypothetical protein